MHIWIAITISTTEQIFNPHFNTSRRLTNQQVYNVVTTLSLHIVINTYITHVSTVIAK